MQPHLGDAPAPASRPSRPPLQDGLPEHDKHTGLATLPERGPRRPPARLPCQHSGFYSQFITLSGFWAHPTINSGHTTLRGSEQSRPPLGGNVLISRRPCAPTAALAVLFAGGAAVPGGLGWAGRGTEKTQQALGSRLSALGCRPRGDSEPQPSQTRGARGRQTPRGRGQGAAWAGKKGPAQQDTGSEANPPSLPSPPGHSVCGTAL